MKVKSTTTRDRWSLTVPPHLCPEILGGQSQTKESLALEQRPLLRQRLDAHGSLSNSHLREEEEFSYMSVRMIICYLDLVSFGEMLPSESEKVGGTRKILMMSTDSTHLEPWNLGWQEQMKAVPPLRSSQEPPLRHGSEPHTPAGASCEWHLGAGDRGGVSG